MDGNTSFELEIEPDDQIGTIIVIQKDGVDGGSFPLVTGQKEWWIGRSADSDIQLKKTGVIDRHCCIEQHKDKLTLIPYGPVYVNGSAIASQTPTKNTTPSKQAAKRKTIRHKDVVEIAKRSFRIEYPSGHPMTVRRRSSIVKQLSDETPVSAGTKSPGMRARDSMAVTTPLSLANVVKRVATPASMASPGSIKKRRTSSAMETKPRRVTFGRALSPEIFDYRRPPSTPIRKGTTPVRCESSKRPIIKATPLKTMREERNINTPVKEFDLDLSSFQLSPSPEPSDEPKDFAEIEPVSGGGTPSKQSRRRSSVFKPKKLSMSEETPPRRRRTLGGGGGLTPRKRVEIKMKRLSANPVELEKMISKYGKLIKNRLDEFGLPYPKDDNKENKPIEKKLPMPIVQQSPVITVQRVEQVASLNDMRKTAAENVNGLNLDSLDTPCTKFAKRLLAEEENELNTQDMIKTSEEFSFLQESTPVLGSAKKSISLRSRLSVDTVDLFNSTRGDEDFDATDADVSMVANPTDSVAATLDSTLATTQNEAKTPNQAEMKELSKEAPDATKEIETPGETANDESVCSHIRFDEDSTEEPKSPNKSAMEQLLEETTEKTNKTPCQTPTKGLFAEEKESCVKTPNQGSIKDLSKETAQPVTHQTTPIVEKSPVITVPQVEQVATLNDMRKTAVISVHGLNLDSLDTPCTKSAKRLLAKETDQPVTHQTPGQTAMKGLFAEDDASKNQPKTPNQAAMKTLFKEADEQIGTQTPGQTAMKGLFAEEKESCLKTPNQGAMKDLFKETIQSVTHQTPGQTAMKGLFAEQQSKDAQSPNQGAMKKLFNQSAAPTSPVMEKTVLQGVFAENDDNEPSTVESIFKGMANKSFSHYTTPSKKTPFEDENINWPSRVLREHEPVVISTIDFENDEDMAGMDVLIQEACIDNYMLAALFAEKGPSLDESLVCEPGELMMEILFGEHAAPVDVEIDHEISFSTQSIINHMKQTVDDDDEEEQEEADEQVVIEDKPRSTRKAAPRVKVQLGVRRSTRRSVEPMPEQATTPPKKTSRRTTKKKEEEMPVVDASDEEPRQTRTRKASGKVEEEIEPVESKPVKKSRKATAKPAVSEPVEMEEKPKRRGRLPKKTVDAEEEVVEQEPEETEPIEKPKRRGRAKNVTEEDEAAVKMESAEIEPEEKPKKRGRAAKKVVKEEEEAPVPEIEHVEEMEPGEKPKSRGRAVKKVAKEVEEEAAVPENEHVEEEEEEEKPKVVRKKAAPKKKLSKTDKFLQNQKKLSVKVKEEQKERCADGFDVGQVPEVIMEEVETKSIVRRGQSKPSNRVQFNSSDEHLEDGEEKNAALVEKEVEEKSQKRKTTKKETVKKTFKRTTASEDAATSSEGTPADEEVGEVEDKPKRKARTKKTTTKAEPKTKAAKRTKDTSPEGDESVEVEAPKRSRKKTVAPLVEAEPKRSTRSSARLKK